VTDIESMSRVNKFRYNILSIGAVNYWGIPKCGNTAVKLQLFRTYFDQLTEDKQSLFKRNKIRDGNTGDQVKAWVHSHVLGNYITPTEANNNGRVNFSVVREPSLRLLSMLRDGRLGDMDRIRELLRSTPVDELNIHLRPMSWFLSPARKINLYTISALSNCITPVNKSRLEPPDGWAKFVASILVEHYTSDLGIYVRAHEQSRDLDSLLFGAKL